MANFLNLWIFTKHTKIVAAVSVGCIATTGIVSVVTAEVKKNMTKTLSSSVGDAFSSLGSSLSGLLGTEDSDSFWSDLPLTIAVKMEPFREFLRASPGYIADAPETIAGLLGKARGHLVETGLPAVQYTAELIYEFFVWLFTVETLTEGFGYLGDSLDQIKTFGGTLKYFFVEVIWHYIKEIFNFLVKYFDTIKNAVIYVIVNLPSWLETMPTWPEKISKFFEMLSTNWDSITELLGSASLSELSTMGSYIWENRNDLQSKLETLKKITNVSSGTNSVFSGLDSETKNLLMDEFKSNPKKAIKTAKKLNKLNEAIQVAKSTGGKQTTGFANGFISSLEKAGLTKNFQISNATMKEILKGKGTDAAITAAITKDVAKNVINTTLDSIKTGLLSWFSSSSSGTQ